jgi:transcriptional regulator with XRE-family HTH domain
MSSAQRLAKNLERLRSERGLSQAALAELVGVEPMAIWNYESCKRWPKARFFDALAKALGVQPSTLLAEPSSVDGEVRIGKKRYGLVEL